jgi:hypothetical protein
VVDDRRIRGVLFDFGDVLIHPIGGRWNPRYDFEDILIAHHPETPVERFPEAFAARCSDVTSRIRDVRGRP